jgi:uncharacterized repeat protein (TIGR02543 family)
MNRKFCASLVLTLSLLIPAAFLSCANPVFDPAWIPLSVTFNLNYPDPVGSVPAQSCARDSLAIEPASPSRAEYLFGGWFTDSSCVNAWNFQSDRVVSSIVLYAKWTAEKPVSGRIVADHTVVDRYDDIPAYYIGLVKRMWFNLPGESHSSGYRMGLQFLEEADGRFAVSVTETGTPEAYTDAHLRASRSYANEYSKWSYGTGESKWYTNAAGIAETKGHLDYANTHGLPPAAFGFGWCWDMSWGNVPGGTMDPVYKVRWAGRSVGGPEGDLRWGLDSGDRELTGNSVSMDSYLAATQSYADYCASKGYATKVFFTTGPVDSYSGENGYQRQLKQDYIRAFVNADAGRILFDYADILAWDGAGTERTMMWTDSDGGSHSYQMIAADNMLDRNGSYAEDGDHIGERGALRLGKAVWWMLARMAGWDGVSAD